VLIKRLYLRNFRVFEDELDLELPPGLVGIHGPNGSGKSTLLEAILFSLWGKARTPKELIRTSGVGGECVTETEFEHEGHLYLVRRTLKGLNSAVTVEAHCDGNLMSTGVRDVERYVESVLGMDDAAFRASVFTEQKQLAAFSDQAPAERRRLVLQLLGVTPLDAARDAARRDARQLASDHDRLRGMLADLAALRTDAEDAEASAEAAERVAAEEADAARAAAERAAGFEDAFRTLDGRRQEHDSLVALGRAARQALERTVEDVERRAAELRFLDELAARLPEVEARACGRAHDEDRLERLVVAANALAALERVVVPDRPPDPRGPDLEEARNQAARIREELAGAVALAGAARAEVAKVREACERSASLTGESSCPTCGQPLGDSFETLRSHREAELREAERRDTELAERVERLRPESAAADAALAAAARAAEEHTRSLAEWEAAAARRRDALDSARDAWAAAGGDPAGGLPAAADLAASVEALRSAVHDKREAEAEALSIEVRLQGRLAVEQGLAEATERQAITAAEVEALRDKVRVLAFDPAALAEAAERRASNAEAARRAATQAQEAQVAAAAKRERARAAFQRLADGQEQHARLADLESDSRHRGRTAELLAEFRNAVVSAVGPRLAVQAADLFAELTDREYEGLEVDPDTYQIKISDGGTQYGLERFSGSEVDLANLALRVAISEHIHFQSGGSVGLLVLDEVFGPLDEDRKARMLAALERLRGRFRQVLVVTHDSEIKEQLPSAIEVVKRPGRRATARPVD
jgi:exonuclease SbcC